MTGAASSSTRPWAREFLRRSLYLSPCCIQFITLESRLASRAHSSLQYLRRPWTSSSQSSRRHVLAIVLLLLVVAAFLPDFQIPEIRVPCATLLAGACDITPAALIPDALAGTGVIAPVTGPVGSQHALPVTDL